MDGGQISVNDNKIRRRILFTKDLVVDFAYGQTRSFNRMTKEPNICLSDSHYGKFFIKDREVLYQLFDSLYFPERFRKYDILSMMDSVTPLFKDVLIGYLTECSTVCLDTYFVIENGEYIIKNIECVDYSDNDCSETLVSLYYNITGNLDDSEMSLSIIKEKTILNRDESITVPSLVMRKPGIGYIFVKESLNKMNLIINGVAEFVQPLHEENLRYSYFRVRVGHNKIEAKEIINSDIDKAIQKIDSYWHRIMSIKELKYSAPMAKNIWSSHTSMVEYKNPTVVLRSNEIDMIEASYVEKAKNWPEIKSKINSFSSFGGGEK